MVSIFKKEQYFINVVPLSERRYKVTLLFKEKAELRDVLYGVAHAHLIRLRLSQESPLDKQTSLTSLITSSREEIYSPHASQEHPIHRLVQSIQSSKLWHINPRMIESQQSRISLEQSL